jgi:uncharacterized membrane protein YgdD (TMEM256/DUF423 family)
MRPKPLYIGTVPVTLRQTLRAILAIADGRVNVMNAPPLLQIVHPVRVHCCFGTAEPCPPMNNARTIFIVAGIAGLTGVLAGTFGAHGLRGRLTPELLDIFEVGVRYHLMHAVALLALGAVAAVTTCSVLLRWTAWLFAIGILVFSGSLYLLATTGQKWLGMITPFGGFMFILGWLCVTIFGVRMSQAHSEASR